MNEGRHLVYIFRLLALLCAGFCFQCLDLLVELLHLGSVESLSPLRCGFQLADAGGEFGLLD